MIQLLSDVKHIIDKDIQILSDIDLIFLDVVDDFTFLTESDCAYLKSIDGIKKLDGDYILSPFGPTSVKNLSTGMKTLLLLSYFHYLGRSEVIDLNGCGSNVLALIFTDSRYRNNTFFLTHESLPDIETYPFKVEKIDKVFTNLKDYLNYCMDLELKL